jgi:transposase
MTTSSTMAILPFVQRGTQQDEPPRTWQQELPRYLATLDNPRTRREYEKAIAAFFRVPGVPEELAALTPDGLQAPWTIEGAIDAEAFERYITEVLGPTLRPGQLVILDNLSVHKAASIREAIEARACELLFLPPYTPDMTPIEQAFSKIKALLRGLGARTREALLEAVRLAVDAITPEDATGWFAHAGYALPAQDS